MRGKRRSTNLAILQKLLSQLDTNKDETKEDKPNVIELDTTVKGGKGVKKDSLINTKKLLTG